MLQESMVQGNQQLMKETIQKRLQKAVNEICRNEKQVAQNRANFINKKKSSDLER